MNNIKRLLSICICFILLTVIIPDTATAKTATSEIETAYEIIKNCQAGNYGEEVAFEEGIDYDRVLGYVSSVIPEKVLIIIKTVTNTNSGEKTYFASAEVLDPYVKEAYEKADKIVDEIITDTMDTKEKIRALHDWLVLNTEYDLNAEFNDPYSGDVLPYTLSGPLLYSVGVCDGYSSAMMALCRAAGIECFKINSYTMNHSWNYIYDGRYWSFTDATYDDPVGGNGKVYYDNFMRSARDFIDSGYIFDDGKNSTLSLQDYDNFFAYYYKRETGGDLSEKEHQQRIAEILDELGMFRGTPDGYELERMPTRGEMAVVLVRLMGAETQALEKHYSSPFTDTLWAGDYIGYLYKNGYSIGIGNNLYGTNNLTSLKDCSTVLLRLLGYSDKDGDFSWETSLSDGNEKGILTDNIINKTEFTRGDMAEMMARTLFCKNKNGTMLINDLIESGAVDYNSANSAMNKLTPYISDLF